MTNDSLTMTMAFRSFLDSL